MDKQSFVEYIKTLDLNPEIKKTILGYVKSHEFNENLVENVAQLLENAADQSEMAAEELDKVIAIMEEVKDNLDQSSEEYTEAYQAAQQKYQEDVTALLDQKMAAAPAQEEKQAMPDEVAVAPVEETVPENTPESPTEAVAEPLVPVVPVVDEAVPPVEDAPAAADLNDFSPAPSPQPIPPLPGMDLNDLSPAPQEPLPPLPVIEQPMAAPMQPRDAEQPSIMGEQPPVEQVNDGTAPAVQAPTF